MLPTSALSRYFVSLIGPDNTLGTSLWEYQPSGGVLLHMPSYSEIIPSVDLAKLLQHVALGMKVELTPESVYETFPWFTTEPDLVANYEPAPLEHRAQPFYLETVIVMAFGRATGLLAADDRLYCGECTKHFCFSLS